MNPKITQQDIAVLGLLYEHNHYTYRLQEIAEKRGMEAWADIEYSKIPNTLEKLKKDGLINSEIRKIDVDASTNDENAKEVYYITDKGRNVLINEIKSVLSNKSKIIYPFNLGLANISVLDDNEISESLKIYLESVEEQIKYLESSIILQKEMNIPYNFISIYKRSVPLLKAEKDWVKEFMKELK
jgi:DNA-binding PadR family transcriptional regulator